MAGSAKLTRFVSVTRVQLPGGPAEADAARPSVATATTHSKTPPRRIATILSGRVGRFQPRHRAELVEPVDARERREEPPPDGGDDDRRHAAQHHGGHGAD